MKELLQKLIDAADAHGEDSDPDHTVGDLQGMLWTAWELLPSSGKKALLESNDVENVVDLGARGAFTVSDLLADLQAEMERKLEALNKAHGVTIKERHASFQWETESQVGPAFASRLDAIDHAERIFRS